MALRRSAEAYLAELNDILRCYRASEASGLNMGREEALARLRNLGFTAGEAVRLLRRPGAHDQK